MKIYNYVKLLLLGFLTTVTAFASEQMYMYDAPKGFGDIASNVFGVELTLRQFFQTTTIIIGVALIILSFFKYLHHRKNSVETPLSTVITLFLMGVALIILAFIPLHTY